jgi:hypothetical protein
VPVTGPCVDGRGGPEELTDSGESGAGHRRRIHTCSCPLLGVYGRARRRPSELRTSRTRRDLIAPAPLPRRARHNWADIIDFLTMHPEERRKALRLLGEIKAAEQR